MSTGNISGEDCVIDTVQFFVERNRIFEEISQLHILLNERIEEQRSSLIARLDSGSTTGSRFLDNLFRVANPLTLESYEHAKTLNDRVKASAGKWLCIRFKGWKQVKCNLPGTASDDVDLIDTYRYVFGVLDSGEIAIHHINNRLAGITIPFSRYVDVENNPTLVVQGAYKLGVDSPDTYKLSTPDNFLLPVFFSIVNLGNSNSLEFLELSNQISWIFEGDEVKDFRFPFEMLQRFLIDNAIDNVSDPNGDIPNP